MRPTQQIRDIINRLSQLETTLAEGLTDDAMSDDQGVTEADEDTAGKAEAEQRAKGQLTISRMFRLAQRGLVDKGHVSALNTAVRAMVAGSPLSTPQRLVMLDAMQTLMDLLDDTSLVSRIQQDLKKKEQEATSAETRV